MSDSVAQEPPWTNGQGVGLLIRRLRVRVPQGVTGELRKVWVGEAAAARKCRDVQQCPHDARAESCVARSSDGLAVAFDHCQRQLRPCAVPHQRSHSLPILQEHPRRPTEHAVAPGWAHFETTRSVSVAAAPSTRATELCLGTSPDFTGLNLGAHI